MSQSSGDWSSQFLNLLCLENILLNETDSVVSDDVKIGDGYLPLLELLHAEKIFIEESDAFSTSSAHLIIIKAEGWNTLARLTRLFGFRWVAIWVNQVETEFQITLCLELQGQYLLLRTSVSIEKPEVHSWAAYYPAADRAERHIHDMFGVIFFGHPDLRRWTRHQAWRSEQFPLRKEFLISNSAVEKTLPDVDYPFQKIEGHGVCEVPVGPVHAGIIEPGHFRFQIAGEDVLFLEERLGYVHKGIEKLAEGRTVDGLIRLAGKVSGDSTVSHAWAAAQACEKAAALDVPLRAVFIRAIMAERERIANHLGDIGAICNDVGFAFGYYQFNRLRELWQRMNFDIFGHRFMMGCIIFGGVKKDLSDQNSVRMREQIKQFHKEVTELFAMLEENSSLQDRLKTTGILTPNAAKKIGAVGYVGRASGYHYDVRHDAPYAPYDQVTFDIPVFKTGDVAARLQVRAEEIVISLRLLEEFLSTMPATEICSTTSVSLENTEGLGLIEGFRGEILAYVSFDHEGRVSRYFPRDPSWLNWPALEHLACGNLVPDFPACNKSVNGSYSGHDL